MSSLRNAVKRVTHKERAQPRSRRRFGLLEKHQDYVERARDHHKKRDFLTRLRRKAALRNPDEFYHGMVHTQTKAGVHELDRDDAIDTDTVQLLKTQDVAYLSTAKRKEEEKIRRLREGLHDISAPDKEKSTAKHTLFVDSEKDLKGFDAAEHFDTAPELVGRAFNRTRRAQLAEQDVAGADDAEKTLRSVRKERGKKYRELKAREKRVEQIGKTLEHVQTQRKVMGKGTKRKIKSAEDGKPAQYRWKRVRAK